MRGCEVCLSNYLTEEMDDPATKVELVKAMVEETDWAAILADCKKKMVKVISILSMRSASVWYSGNSGNWCASLFLQNRRCNPGKARIRRSEVDRLIYRPTSPPFLREMFECFIFKMMPELTTCLQICQICRATMSCYWTQ